MTLDRVSKIKQLRVKLKELREERAKAIFEKGMAATDNKDLRENATYDYWEQKEFTLTARIISTMKEIDTLSKSK